MSGRPAAIQQLQGDIAEIIAVMRMCEVLGVEVRDIDFDGHRIFIRRAMSAGVSLTPKSGHERVVPMLPELEARLRDAVRRKLPKARIVVTEKGDTPRRSYVLRRLKTFLKRAGLKERSFLTCDTTSSRSWCAAAPASRPSARSPGTRSWI